MGTSSHSSEVKPLYPLRAWGERSNPKEKEAAIKEKK
jgi:hypothetical protein